MNRPAEVHLHVIHTRICNVSEFLLSRMCRKTVNKFAANNILHSSVVLSVRKRHWRRVAMGGGAVLERPSYTQLCAIRFREIRFRTSGEYPQLPPPPNSRSTRYILYYYIIIIYYIRGPQNFVIIYTYASTDAYNMCCICIYNTHTAHSVLLNT